MHHDDSLHARLSDDERREFDELTRSLRVGRWSATRASIGDRGWWLVGYIGVAASVLTIGMAPMVVPFICYVVAVFGVHRADLGRLRTAWQAVRRLATPPADRGSGHDRWRP